MNYGTSTVISVKQGKILRWFLFAILLGTVFGSVLYSMYPTHTIWQNTLFRQGMGTAAAALDFPDMLLAVCGVSVLWTLCAAILGMSLTGVPLTICLLVFRAAILGAILSELYCLQGTAGFLTAVLFVMPYALVSTFVFTLGVRESVRFSASLFRLVRHNREEPLSVRLYALRFLILALLTLAAGILQCVWLKYGYVAFLEQMVKG